MSERGAGFWRLPASLVAYQRMPLTVIREQAALLDELTEHRLLGRVSTINSGDKLITNLQVVAPGLDYYRVTLVEYSQPLAVYPGRLRCLLDDDFAWDVDDLTAFTDRLAQLLASPVITHTLGMLLAQSV